MSYSLKSGKAETLAWFQANEATIKTVLSFINYISWWSPTNAKLPNTTGAFKSAKLTARIPVFFTHM